MTLEDQLLDERGEGQRKGRERERSRQQGDFAKSRSDRPSLSHARIVSTRLSGNEITTLKSGGRYWTRTSDPYRVKVML